MSSLAAECDALAADAAVALALVAVDGPGRAAARQAGARAAHEALRRAGCHVPELTGHAGDGRPLWPQGFTGSIAHRDAVAVAAAAPTATHAAVGIDVERAAALPAADAELVLAPEENAAVAAAADPDAVATSLWSAKEAAFKAWSTATGGELGPVDPVDLRVRLESGGALEVTARGPLAPAAASVGALSGRCVTADGYVVTLVVRPRGATAAG